MTPTQIENKIRELEYWLEHNHAHPDRSTVSEDLRKLKEQLINMEADAPGGD